MTEYSKLYEDEETVEMEQNVPDPIQQAESEVAENGKVLGVEEMVEVGERGKLLRDDPKTEIPIESVAYDIEQLEEGGRFDAFSKITLSWKDLRVSASLSTTLLERCKKTDKPTSKEILKGVSGIVEPGHSVAIMGASGAGKTTLLNTLAFRNASQISTTGVIRVNGEEVSQSKIKKVSAYVQQADCFVGTLTVLETMVFHANLRMDPTITAEARQQKINAILNNLSLMKIKDSLVGNTTGMLRGISGGERKRLSVATELIMDPPLLFIDEPTSGLDSFMAENIVTHISKLAKANRTILCTIHQPTSEVFALFDRVCLVSEGEIAYMGDSSSVLEHFRSAGYPCRENFNPADHYIFTLAIRPGQEEQCRGRCEQMIAYYKKSDNYREMLDKIDSTEDSSADDVIFKAKDISKMRIRSSLGVQISENFKRSFRNILRNPIYTKTRIMQSLVIGLLMGLAYLNTENDQRVAQNKSGAIFNLIVYFTFGNIAIQTMQIPSELPVIHREYQNGMYSSLPYFLSKIVSEIPYLFGLPLITMSLCYFMMGFRADFMAFTACVIGIAGICWCGTGLGWFLSTLTGDQAIAGALIPPMIMPFFLFGGLYQNEESTPIYFLPVKWTSWFRYGFNMLMANEFDGLEISCTSEPCAFRNSTDVLAHFAITPGDIWWPNIAALFLIGTVLCFLSWTCLVIRVRRN